MPETKETDSLKGGESMSPHTSDMLSKQQAAYQKSEEKNYPLVDNRKEARKLHTQGSMSSEKK